jgi:hypothetical protein
MISIGGRVNSSLINPQEENDTGTDNSTMPYSILIEKQEKDPLNDYSTVSVNALMCEEIIYRNFRWWYSSIFYGSPSNYNTELQEF